MLERISYRNKAVIPLCMWHGLGMATKNNALGGKKFCGTREENMEGG